MCVNEFTAYLADEPHSDSPECVDPYLTYFLMGLNDSLPDDLRQQLRPYAARTIGTAGDGHSEMRPPGSPSRPSAKVGGRSGHVPYTKSL